MFSIRGPLQSLLCYKIHGSGSSRFETQPLLRFLPLLQILLLTQQDCVDLKKPESILE